MMLNKQQVINLLKSSNPDLIKRFGISRIAIFGSVARNEAKEGSDIDVLVSFSDKVTSKNFFGLQFYLEDQLNASIDLVTENAVRNELKPYINKDVIYV